MHAGAGQGEMCRHSAVCAASLSLLNLDVMLTSFHLLHHSQQNCNDAYVIHCNVHFVLGLYESSRADLFQESFIPGRTEKTKNFDVYGQVQWHTAGARKT